MRHEHLYLLLGFLLGLVAAFILVGLPARAHGQGLKAGDVTYLHRVYPGGLNVEWALQVFDDSPVDAQAYGGEQADYTFTGVTLAPGHRTFYLNTETLEPPSGSAFVGPAVQGWNGISPNFTATYGGLSPVSASICHGDPADGTNLIKWGSLGTGVIAIACWYQGLECDSLMSPAFPTVDMKTVEMHEMGHCFGLGHSEDPNALMYFQYHGALSGPQADDIAGFCVLYGCGATTPTPTPTNTPSPTPTGTPTATPTPSFWCPRPQLPHCVIIPGIARDGPAEEHAPFASQEVVEPVSSGFQRQWWDAAGGRWRDSDGNVWLADRQLWWDGGLYYWVGNEWLDGAGHPRGWVEPVAVVSAQGRGYAGFEALVALYDWPVHEALAVAYCESHYQNVQNSSGGPYFGPFQMWSGHFGPGEDYWDVPTNVAVAYRVWSGSGWAPWDCKP